MDEPVTQRKRWWKWAPTLVGLLLLLWCVTPLRAQWSAGQWPAARSADAKPLFLAARAVQLGADPLDPKVLQTLAGQAGMREGGGAGAVRASDPLRGADKGGAYASMYPVSAGLVFSMVPAAGWADFVDRFRRLGFWLLVVGAGAAGAAGAARRRTAALGAAMGVATVLLLSPPLSEGLGVGQANVHIAGLTGLALGAMATGWASLFALTVVVGLGIKLMPVALVAPAATARWWRGVAWTALLGLGLVLWVAGVAPLADVGSDVLESVRYQAAVAPKWVLRNPPREAFVLFHLRQGPLGAVTGALALAVLVPSVKGQRWWRGRWIRGWVATAAPPADRVVAAVLAAAWMAVLGAGSQRIYAVLQVPVWAWLAGAVMGPSLRWPARLGAGLLALLVFVPGLLTAERLPGWDGRAIVLLSAWVAWGAVGLRAVIHGWPRWGWPRRAAVMGLLLWLGGVGLWWASMAPQG